MLMLKPDYIFEVSWEVCNKIGGIYTVLSSKAPSIQEDFDDKESVHSSKTSEKRIAKIQRLETQKALMELHEREATLDDKTILQLYSEHCKRTKEIAIG